MRYQGGKTRIAKHILPIMLRERFDEQWWVEPFVGGGGMISQVEGNRIGADINPWTIQALTVIRDRAQYLPANNREFTESDYANLWNSDECWFKGFAGFAYSFGGKWRGGWSRNQRGDDYAARAYRAALKQSPTLAGVKLYHHSYSSLYDAACIPEESIIYCDPPYQGTTGYNGSPFNHEQFWQWCRRMSSIGHRVFISEYTAPEDFSCIWEGHLVSNLRRATDTKTTEKLFTL